MYALEPFDTGVDYVEVRTCLFCKEVLEDDEEELCAACREELDKEGY